MVIVCFLEECQGHDSYVEALHHCLGDLVKRAARIEHKEDAIMGAIEDLQAVDTELAAAVTDLSASVDRIDTDFAALEAAVAAGNSDQIEAEVAKIRASIDAAKQAKANIDTTDPQAPTSEGDSAVPA